MPLGRTAAAFVTLGSVVTRRPCRSYIATSFAAKGTARMASMTPVVSTPMVSDTMERRSPRRACTL